MLHKTGCSGNLSIRPTAEVMIYKTEEFKPNRESNACIISRMCIFTPTEIRLPLFSSQIRIRLKIIMLSKENIIET